MSPSPARLNKPTLLLFDTSTLMQILVSEHFPLLRHLRSDFGVQSIMVPAVESEALYLVESGPPRFRGRQEQLKKAITNRTIAVVSKETLAPFYGTSSESWLRQIDLEGMRLYGVVDRGEAFTHAASMILDALVVSNDTTAVTRLLRDNEPIPLPVLRFWDLIVFGHQIGFLEEGDCDRTRQFLKKIGERQPTCFSDCSYLDGLKRFYARLADPTKPSLGAAHPQERHDTRVQIRRLDDLGATD